MDIHEYQAKEILARFGVATPKGALAYSPEQAAYRAREIGGKLWVVKAQVHTGGRGKAGGQHDHLPRNRHGRIAPQRNPHSQRCVIGRQIQHHPVQCQAQGIRLRAVDLNDPARDRAIIGPLQHRGGHQMRPRSPLSAR